MTISQVKTALLVGAFAAFSLTAPLVFTSGCSTKQTSQQRAYKTLSAVGLTANAAVDGWIRYYLKEVQRNQLLGTEEGRVRVEELNKQDSQVKAAYAQFSSTYSIAISSAKLASGNELPSAELVRVSTDLTILIESFIR